MKTTSNFVKNWTPTVVRTAEGRTAPKSGEAGAPNPVAAAAGLAGDSVVVSKPATTAVAKLATVDQYPDGVIQHSMFGSPYVEIFPGVKSPLKVKDGVPYLTVYRGITADLDPTKASQGYGDHVFTTLKEGVARGYMKSFMGLGKSGTIVRMELPLEKAYIAKRAKKEEDDQLLPVLDQLEYIRSDWNARHRLDQLEVVFKLAELGGSLANPEYELGVKAFSRKIPRYWGDMGYHPIGKYDDQIDSLEWKLIQMDKGWIPSDPKERAAREAEKKEINQEIDRLRPLAKEANRGLYFKMLWEDTKVFCSTRLSGYEKPGLPGGQSPAPAAG